MIILAIPDDGKMKTFYLVSAMYIVISVDLSEYYCFDFNCWYHLLIEYYV